MALSVPPSRFTLRVGGGSAFYVRQHDTLMKHTPIILALSLLLTACSRHDAEFTKQIPGVWRQEVHPKLPGSYTNTLTIVPDGTFAYSRFTTKADTTFTNAGTWLIRGGRIVLTATTRSGTHPLSLGELFKAEIVYLDDHTWVFKMDDGHTNSFIR